MILAQIAAKSFRFYTTTGFLVYCGTLFLLEIGLFKKRTGRAYPFRKSAAALSIHGGYALFWILQVYLFGGLQSWVFQHRIFNFTTSSWRICAALFFLADFFHYWQHRFMHAIRWWWTTHIVHHSPTSLIFPVAFQLGWTELISGMWFFYFPMFWLGCPPKLLGSLLGIHILYQLWLHTEIIPKLGPIEWIFVTPSHHRVHHAKNAKYLGKNFGGVLIIYDRIFGTFVAEDEAEPCVFGVPNLPEATNPVKIVFQGWVQWLDELKTRRVVKRMRDSALSWQR